MRVNGSLWLGLLGLLLVCLGATSLFAGVASAEGLFKDLQILPKTITKDELKAIMREQAKALDVECDHCHKVPDMDAETPNKKTARQMMKMTGEINDKWIKGIKDADKNKVTCGTCHRGHETPPKFEVKK